MRLVQMIHMDGVPQAQIPALATRLGDIVNLVMEKTATSPTNGAAHISMNVFRRVAMEAMDGVEPPRTLVVITIAGNIALLKTLKRAQIPLERLQQ